MDDSFLKHSKYGLREGVETFAFQIVEEAGAEFFLIRALDDSQIGLQNRLLVRLQVVEQVRLY